MIQTYLNRHHHCIILDMRKPKINNFLTVLILTLFAASSFGQDWATEKAEELLLSLRHYIVRIEQGVAQIGPEFASGLDLERARRATEALREQLGRKVGEGLTKAGEHAKQEVCEALKIRNFRLFTLREILKSRPALMIPAPDLPEPIPDPTLRYYSQPGIDNYSKVLNLMDKSKPEEARAFVDGIKDAATSVAPKFFGNKR